MANDIPPQPTPYATAQVDPMAALLNDLTALSEYLHQRGQTTYTNAQQFAQHARQNTDTRQYDERQATMLEYQHQVWKEIAGLVDRLAVRYTEIHDTTSDED